MGRGLCDGCAMEVWRGLRGRASLWLFLGGVGVALLGGGAVAPAGSVSDEPRVVERDEVGELLVEVTQLSHEGVLYFELYDARGLEGWGGEALRRVSLPARPPRAHWRVEALPSGEYAVRVFLDVNDNERLDRSSKGIPKEAFGFSNDAMGKRGLPKPSQASFSFDGRSERIAIRLRSRKPKSSPTPPETQVDRTIDEY